MAPSIMAMEERRMGQMEALVAARGNLGAGTILSLLPVGALFKFQHDPAILVKTGDGRYRVLGGTQTYRTGRNVAVTAYPNS